MKEQSHLVKNNEEVLEMVKQINNEKIEKLVGAERRFMQIIGGGCKYPVGAHAEVFHDKVVFRAMAYKPEFSELKKMKIETSLENLFEVAENTARMMLSEK